MIQPVIGIPVVILMLLRGNIAAIAGGLALLAITNGLAIGYIIHHGGPALTDLSYWQAFDYRNYIAALPAISANQSPIGLDLNAAIQTWAQNNLTLDLSRLLPAVVLVVSGLAIWSERNAGQRTGIISRSGHVDRVGGDSCICKIDRRHDAVVDSSCRRCGRWSAQRKIVFRWNAFPVGAAVSVALVQLLRHTVFDGAIEDRSTVVGRSQFRSTVFVAYRAGRLERPQSGWRRVEFGFHS